MAPACVADRSSELSGEGQDFDRRGGRTRTTQFKESLDTRLKGHSRNRGLDFYDCSLTSHMGKSFPNNISGCSKTFHPVSTQATRFLRWMSTYCAHGWREENFKIFTTTAGDRNGAKKCTMYSFQSSSLFAEAGRLQAKVREKSLPKPCRVYAALEFIPKRKKALKSIWWQSSRVS